MLEKDKLHVLLRTTEATEHQAALAVKSLLEVCDERQLRLKDSQDQLLELQKRLQQLREGRVSKGLAQGDGRHAASASGAVKRLTASSVKIETIIAERQAELDRAIERCQLAEEELLSARVEKKKIEHLLSNKEQRSRLQKSARDEMADDELASRFRKK